MAQPWGMTDSFALLGVPRRFWLEEEALKERFHTLTAEHHPDVAGEAAGRAFAALNVAYQTLRDPRARLRHWLELEAPGAGTRATVPAAAEAFFPAVAAKKEALEAFLKRRTAAGGAVAKALLFPEQFALHEGLEECLAALERERTALLGQLPALDAQWQAATPEERRALTNTLLEAAQTLGYLERWAAQLREGIVQLQTGG